MTGVVISLPKASSKVLFRLSGFDLQQADSIVEIWDNRHRRSKRDSKQRSLKFGSKDQSPKKSPKQSPTSESAKRKFRSRRSWVRRLNLDRQDDLKQLNFRRSINRNSLEGIEVAKLFYILSLKKILSTQRRKKGISKRKMYGLWTIFYCICFTINASLFPSNLLHFIFICVRSLLISRRFESIHFLFISLSKLRNLNVC